MTDKPRSIDQHKRFFGLVRALYHHWPEAQEFRPDSEEHLRAFLLVKAGHRIILTFAVDHARDLAKWLPIIVALMLKKHCWAWTAGDLLKVCAPETTRFDQMTHAKACAVYNAVDQYLAMIGIDPEQILKETENAA